MSAALSVQTESSQTTRPSETKVDKYVGPFRGGAWHEQDSRPIDAALAHLADACPGLMPLARFVLPRVPRALLASSTLKTEAPSSHYTILPKAVRRQWIGWNSRQQEMVNAICIDCDKEGWRERLRSLLERGVPAPAYIAASKPRLVIDQKGNLIGKDYETGHLVWFLAVPVKRNNLKAHDLFRRVRTMLVGEMDGDPAAANHLTKNPFHRAYVTEVMRLESVDLADLYKPLMEWCGEGEHALPPRAYTPGEAFVPKRMAVRLGTARGQLDPEEAKKWGKLFAARHAIMAADARDLPTILAMVEEHAAEHCAVPKDHKERRILRQRIKDHATSIHQWMNTAWKGGLGKDRAGIDHGVMTREAHERGPEQASGWHALDERSKRILAAERTNGLRRERTVEAVSAAVLRLWNEGATLTQVAIAAAAGVSKREVERLWNEVGTLSKVDTRSYQGFLPQGGLPQGATPQGEPLGGGNGGTPLLTLKQVSILSKEKAKAARIRMEGEARAARDEAKRVAGLVLRYEAHAVAMGKRGVVPLVPPCLPWGTKGEGSPEVLAAYQAALDATADAVRRHEARLRGERQQEQAKQRRADFSEWARAGNVAAFKGFLAQQAGWWDHLLQGKEDAVRDRMEVARRGAFARYWREWSAACSHAAGEALAAAGHLSPSPSPTAKASVDSGMAGFSRRAPGTKVFRTTMDALDRMAAAVSVPSNEDQARVAQPEVRGIQMPSWLISRPSFLSRDVQSVAPSSMRGAASMVTRFRTVPDAIDILAELAEVAA